MNPLILNDLQQRFGTADFGQYQIVRKQWYDYVRLAPAGTNQVTFFSNPLGAQDPVGGTGKTQEQTNLVKTASFGQEYFALTQIRLDAFFAPNVRQTTAPGTNFCFQGNTSLADNAMEAFNDLLHRGVLEVKFAQKLYFQIGQPFLTAPAGFGLDIAALGASKPVNSVNKDNYEIRPDARASSVYVVEPFQMIEPEIQVEAALLFPGGINSPTFTNKSVTSDGTTTFTPAIFVGLIFDGYSIRPSQ
jgi:hypothetical protein